MVILSPSCLGRVAEWQTRWLQVPVSFGTWGFKSPFAHTTAVLRTDAHKVTNPKGFVTFVFVGGCRSRKGLVTKPGGLVVSPMREPPERLNSYEEKLATVEPFAPAPQSG